MKFKINYLAILLSLAGLFLMPVSAYSGTATPNLSNAEVIVKSSVNTSYVGMTNTDSRGHFILKGVPTGGINVFVRRNNQIIAQGSAIFKGGSLSEIEVANYIAPPPSNALKSSPAK